VGTGISSASPSPDITSFWQAIVDENIIRSGGRVWNFRDNVAWIGGAKTMYVRDCYVSIANQLLGEANAVDLDAPGVAAVPIALILGPKGIGKTMFLNYLIVRIVEKAKAVGSLDSLSIVYYHQSHGSTEEGIRFASSGCSFNAGKADYYLSDSLDIADGTLGSNLLLEVASENQNNYKKFSDRLTEGNGKQITMDVWSLDELKRVKRAEWGDGEVEFLYAVFGGRVRNFLGGDLDAEAVDDGIDQLAVWFFGADAKNTYARSWNRAMQLIRQTIVGAKGKTTKDELAIQTSLFWVVNSRDGQSGFSSTFLKFVAGQMKKHMETSLWNELARLVGGTGQGLWFEACGHMKLTQTNKNYQAKILKKNGKKKFNINFSTFPKVLIRCVADIATLDNDFYGLPIFGNFMLVDAIIKPNILLQFTVGESHGHVDDIDKWANIRGNLGGSRKNDKLIFVIPASNFAKFSYVGVPNDMECYCMTWEEVANDAVTAGIKRKYR